MYRHLYSAEELALDPSFQQWVQQPDDPAHKAFWEEWLQQHPHKRAETEQARQLVTAAISCKQSLPDGEKRELWRRIQQTLRQEAPARKLEGWRSWQRIAAAITLLWVTFSAGWFAYNRPVAVETAFGALTQVTLPDNSSVMLNGNSRLTYPRSWAEDQPREVWLEGEAFFRVTHQKTPGNARFLVHTQGVTVEVLGTQFNVSQRAGKARVVLTSGKVQLAIANQPNRLVMQPGEVVEIAGTAGNITHKMANTRKYTSWQNQELVFEATPLSEIAQTLQHTYGLQVRFNQPALQDQRISGTLPSDNVDILLMALEKSSNLKIIRTDNTILITNDSTFK